VSSRRKVVRQASKLEQAIRRSKLVPAGSRYVIVFTDEAGQHIGVATNTNRYDSHTLLVCALNGLNQAPHKDDVIDAVE